MNKYNLIQDSTLKCLWVVIETLIDHGLLDALKPIGC